MTASEVLSQLSERNIEVWVEGDKLRFRARKDALTPDLRDAMVANKEEIIKILREQASHIVNYYPLSYAQQSMWIVNQNAPDSAAYNVSFSARICSEVDIPAFRQAFQALVDRHAVLRTVYSLQDDIPVQQIQGQVDVHFEQIDASKWDAETLEQQAIQAYEQPFDLEHGPMMRVFLFTVDPKNHVLLIAAQHIAVDGWSVWLLLDELRALYDAYHSGHPAALPRLAKTYVDYAKQETELLNGPEGERMWSFWRGQLGGELPILNLPLDAPRPQIPTNKGASQIITIDQALTGKLKDLGKAEGTTIFTVVLSAFAVLLYRYSGQETVLIGSPTFGRNGADLARIVGHFINMITLRADFPPETTFRSFLRTMRRVVLDALENQDYPFPLLIQRLGGHRDSSRSPLFDVTFDMQRVQQIEGLTDLFNPDKTDVRIPFGSLEMEPYLMHQQEGQFDLSIQMVDAGDTITGMFKYRVDLFKEATIERMRGHFLMLLEGMTAQPDISLDQLPMMTEVEQDQILHVWNQTETIYPHVTLHQLFEAQVERTPESPAIIFEGQSLSYLELNQRANQFAHHLRKLDIQPGTPIGLMIERSLDMLVGLIGIVKAGGVYVPMDPAYPSERLGYMIEDSHMPAIISMQHLIERMPEHQAQVICLDTDWPQIQTNPIENPPVVTGPEDLVYIIFTSGSTGRPKGVQIPHRALTNFLLSMQHEPGIAANDVLVSVTTLSFDIAGLELYLPLISGARTVIASREAIADGTRLAQLLEEVRATMFQATPVTYQLLLEAGWRGRKNLKMLIGGEALPRRLAEQLLSLGGELWNMYGPTETTIWSTVCRISPDDPTISIGHPIANTQVYVLDNHLQPVPVGVPGVLYIGGTGLAKGYIGRPDLTQERFIHNPFGPANTLIYNTGDQAAYLPDGRLKCFGRVDHQVKVNGFRIELGEIETAISKYPGVAMNVVVVRELAVNDKRLVAYLTLNEGETVSTPEIRQFLTGLLPDYMVPPIFVILDAMPLTPNGKIDRKALPEPTGSTRPMGEAAEPPQSHSEKLVAEIWSEVLKIEQIGVYDNFFDLGGHSLMAMQAINKLNQKTGIKFEPAFMRFQTLKQIAAFYDTP